MAIKEPIRMPRVIDIPTNNPTCSLESSLALAGAITAHIVDIYPLVKENSIILMNLNQSAEAPNSQSGGT